MRIIRFFIFCLFFIGLFSKGIYASEKTKIPLKYFVQGKLGKDHFEVQLYRSEDGEKQLNLFEPDSQIKKEEEKKWRLLYSFDREMVGTILVEVAMIQFKSLGRFYLLMKWTRGAHGQDLFIVDFLSDGKKIVYYQPSSWPMTYDVLKNKIIINGKGDMKPDGSGPYNRVKEWKP